MYLRFAPQQFRPPSLDGETDPNQIELPIVPAEKVVSMDRWPALNYDDWKDTLGTLHLWTQIVGKIRLELEPMLNHWWNVTLYVTPRGLTTSAMPYSGGRWLRSTLTFWGHASAPGL